MERSKIQIVVPVFNEGENVRILYRGLCEEGVSFDVIRFVYDFDEDSTVPVLRELQQEDDRIILEKNQFGRGVLKALRWGFSRSECGPVVVLMGDNSDKLSIIPKMVELWSQGAVVVSPSRYMSGGEQHGGGVLKSNLSRFAGVSLRLLGFPTSDPTNNFKLYDGNWLQEQQIESRAGFEVGLELTYRAYVQGRKIVQLPTVWRDRTMGQSQFQLRKWLPHYLRWYFRCIGALLTRRFVSDSSRRKNEEPSRHRA